MTKFASSLLPLAGGIAVLMAAAAFATRAQAATQGMRPLVVSDYNGPAIRPFQFELCRESNADVCQHPESLVIPVATPNGEPVARYVVEYVSTDCEVATTADEVRSIGLETETSGGTVLHRFVPVRVPAPARVAAAQHTRIYADPGTEIRMSVGAAAIWSVCRTSISGHFVVN